jgi:hypothetical protein
MKANVTGGNLIKTGLVLLSIFIAVNVAFSADSSVKRVKQSSTQPAAQTDPSEWKKVIEAAKKEGKIVISGSPGKEWRRTLVDMFQQEYPEITVEFSADAGRNFWPRIRQERALGKRLWDLRSTGVDPLTMEAKREGVLAPIRPLLLPEIADDSKWIGVLMEYLMTEKNIYLVIFIHRTISACKSRLYQGT